jgi:hypothetical protein
MLPPMVRGVVFMVVSLLVVNRRATSVRTWLEWIVSLPEDDV